MNWKQLTVLAIILIPTVAFLAFVIGRSAGWGWAKSWFEAKKKHEDENKEIKE